MSRFEDNLWREVEDRYGQALSEAVGPLHRRSRLRAPVIAGTSLGVVGASTAAVIVLTAASSSPAFAVTPHRDGTVWVTIHRIDGIPGANRRLAQLGIRARAVQIANGCQATAPRALAPVTVMTLARDGHKNWVTVASGAINARIRPAQIPSGRTLVIPAIRAGAVVRLVRGRAVPGVVPACLPAAVQVLPSPAGTGRTIVSCGTVRWVRPRPVTPGQATNTTSTNAAAPHTTVTQTPAPATTDSGTQTSTNPGSATNPAPSTDPVPTSRSTPVGPGNLPLPPALLRACRLAGPTATR